MNRLSPLIFAAAVTGAVVVAGAPSAALAQTWPAGAIAATGTFVPQSRTFTAAISDAGPLRAVSFRVTRAEPIARPALKLRTARSDPDDIPTVDLRPKDEWMDDQGLRISPTRVAFKRRF